MNDPKNSPTDWVSDHIRRYIATDGEDGHDYLGFPTLLLTTRGRSSGLWRRTALIYGELDGNYVLVASNAAAASHPNWYRNLQADPVVQVQVRARRFAAHARTAQSGEHPRLWSLMTSIYPMYDDYQQSTEREIPVVVLEPTA